jgi:cytochrome c556
MLLRTTIAALVIGVSAGAVVAQLDPIAARKALMKGNNGNARTMVQTMRGQKPYIAETLSTGMTPDADRVGGNMVEVVRNISQLTAADRTAIAAYIKSLPPVEGHAQPKK